MEPRYSRNVRPLANAIPAFAGITLLILSASIALAEPPFSLDTPATKPATTQSASGIAMPDQPQTSGGLVEFFAARFAALEPMYFLVGCGDPDAKFQISLKYQLFAPDGSAASAWPWLSRLYLGYSQTTLWDFETYSRPVYDTSYRPELLYLWTQQDPQWLRGMSRFDLQFGLKHESNGKGGEDSRSLNIAYVQPVFTFGDDGSNKDVFIALAPRAWVYLNTEENNDDIADYRGYADLRVVTGWRGGFQLAASISLGDEFDHPTLVLDGSYPLRNALGKNIDLFLYGQLFTGYGESLLDYDERTTAFRVGIALVR